MSLKRILIIFSIVLGILLVPLIAMQFTQEVNWDIMDFLVATVLLLSVGFLIEFIFRKLKKRNNRYLLIALVILAFLLLWAELAVGIFGSPLAGS